MTRWNEDDFLEELMLPLRRGRAADPCPQVEALRAVADGEASENLKNAIVPHTAECPTCRDLQQRLQAFDAPTITGQEAEWERTEGRLDSWLKGFLASEGAVSKVDRPTRESHPRLWWKRLTTLPVGWQMRWVLVPAATIAVVICSFLVGRLSAPRSRQLTARATSYRSSSPNPTPAATVAEARIPERPDREAQFPQVAPQNPPSPVGAAAVTSSAPTRTNAPAAAMAAPHPSAPATSAAVLTPHAPSNSEEASISSPPEPLQNRTETSAQLAPHAPAQRTVEAGAASGSAPSPRPFGSALAHSARPMPAGMRSAVAYRGATAASEARVEHPPTIPAPPLIRLDAGTRVWISLNSVQSQADGVSEFRGVVLLPVTQSSVVLLGRNTEVSGTMTVRNGKRSVQIREFLSAGAHYRLRSVGGEANLRLLGAGEVVEFDAGKVLETWMATESTYEKLPSESRPPE